MNRRAFLSLAAVSPLAHLLPIFSQKAEGREGTARELKADLVIIGGGVGGIAAALAGARNGLKVILTEEFPWIGGQLTSQGVPPDEHPWIEERGSSKTYRSFRQKVRDFYLRNYPVTDDARLKIPFNPGNGNVSKICHEPRVALAVLLEMLAVDLTAGRIKLLQPYRVVGAELDADRITAVEVSRVGDGRRSILQAPYFVDATEMGELIFHAKVEHVTGAESRVDTKEHHAAQRENPDNHQAFTYCFAMDYQDGKDNRIEEPESYKFWKDYVPKLEPRWPGSLLSMQMSEPATLRPRQVGFNPLTPLDKGLNFWTYRRILDKAQLKDDSVGSDICLVNWPQNDYLLGNLYNDPNWAKHDIAARELSRCLFYWLQTEARRPDGRQGWRGLRLREDVMGTEDGFAQAPYIRESRRIKSIFTVTESHVGVEARANLLGKKVGEFTAEKFSDSIGTGSYRIDLHPSSGGDNYIDVSSLPFQIPLGSLIPVRVENLLPACKNIGTTHITNGCYRLHPVEWSIGEAAGELAAFCISKKRNPKQIRKDAVLLTDFQTKLTKAGMDLDWPEEIAKKVR
jgi:hypothetical protein